MRIVCQQTILIEYHMPYLLFLKKRQIIGGALWVKLKVSLNPVSP